MTDYWGGVIAISAVVAFWIALRLRIYLIRRCDLTIHKLYDDEEDFALLALQDTMEQILKGTYEVEDLPTIGKPWFFTIHTKKLKRWFFVIRCWQLIEETQLRRCRSTDFKMEIDLTSPKARRILALHTIGSHSLGLLLLPKLLVWPSHYDVRMLAGYDTLACSWLARAAARRRPSLWRRLLKRA